MQKKRNNDKQNRDTEKEVEDYTRYGEFIPSFHHWISFGQQKKKAKDLQKEIKD